MTDGLDRVRRGYESATARFHTALASGAAVVSQTCVIGGRTVQVRIVGPQLAEQFLGPWQHLRTPQAAVPPSLSIDVWHRAETGIDLEAPSTLDPLSRFPYEVSADDRCFALRQPETTAWLDRGARHLVAMVGDVGRRALYEAGRPLEMAVLVWLRDAGIPLVHAAFVSVGDAGALILGQSGSGKSTLAGECAAEGLAFLGDDKVAFVRHGVGDFVGFSLSASLHVDRRSLERLPHLADAALAPARSLDDKYRIPLEQVAAAHLRPDARIRAIVMPTLTRQAGAPLEPASRRSALLALSLSTMLSLPTARQHSLDALAALATAIPAYSLRLRGEHTAPALVAELLATPRTADR